jgi:hypothetical protein
MNDLIPHIQCHQMDFVAEGQPGEWEWIALALIAVSDFSGD